MSHRRSLELRENHSTSGFSLALKLSVRTSTEYDLFDIFWKFEQTDQRIGGGGGRHLNFVTLISLYK